MEIIKQTSNLEFDVIYADGTRRRVKEGVLHEADGNEIIFHNGTSDPAVIIASAEDLLKTLKSMGAGLALLSIKMHLSPEGTEVLRELCWFADDLLNNSSADKQGIFRLGQMDMKASICDMLRDAANNAIDESRVGLILAADLVETMEVPNADA